VSATVTLSTTTLARGCGVTDTRVQVASASGLLPGTHLYVDRELMAYVSTGIVGDIGTWIDVRRGVGGTAATAHSGGALITLGRADQFYSTDPVGAPPAAVPVLPYINVLTGDFWQLQGDETLAGQRWWAKRINTHGVGAMGVRTDTLSVSDVTQS
jgi:hypothetical protein